MRAEDRPGVLAEVTKILGDRQISIEAFLQQEPKANEKQVTIIMLTHKVREGNMNEALKAIEQLDSICGEVTRIRMEALG
jgi:homoserine dehydrogenase